MSGSSRESDCDLAHSSVWHICWGTANLATNPLIREVHRRDPHARSANKPIDSRRSGLRRLGQPIFSNAPQPVEVKPVALEGTSTVTRPGVKSMKSLSMMSPPDVVSDQ